MSRYIIAERWQTILTPAAVVQPGTFNSPTAVYSVDQLDNSGECKLETVASPLSNALQEPDIALIKRVRLWSPLVYLGLAGGNTNLGATDSFNLWATRRAPNNLQQGERIQIKGPIGLGEWIDVNQTLSAAGLLAPFTGWTLGADFPNPLTLDSSRVNPVLVGVADLNFVVQVEVAHTLPGILQ